VAVSPRPPAEVAARLERLAAPVSGFRWWFGSDDRAVSRVRGDERLVAVKHPVAGRVGPLAVVRLAPDDGGTRVEATVRVDRALVALWVWMCAVFLVGPFLRGGSPGVVTAAFAAGYAVMLVRVHRRDGAALRALLDEVVS
jgi:hypothetical protein